MITLGKLSNGPHAGRWTWRIDCPPAYRKQNGRFMLARHGIATTKWRALARARLQRRLHEEREPA